MNRKTAIIIGAGPAGLTAAYELARRTDIQPIVIEQSAYMGGISRTVNHKGNRIDIGGHRFFSKSDRVMNWWLTMMPLEPGSDETFVIQYRGKDADVRRTPVETDRPDRVMLVRPRKSRIYFNRSFFDYPVTLNLNTIRNLGMLKMARIGFSYLWRVLFPIRPETNLEEFFINRFGKTLYLTFFKSYTEKVWGVSCRDISAEWGAQRIKGLSITRTLLHIVKRLLPGKGKLSRKNTETSLIEQFLYPKLGPGQMWETVADRVRETGGIIRTGCRVTGLSTNGKRITGVTLENRDTGKIEHLAGDRFFSTMAIQELVNGLDVTVPADVQSISDGLMYRDFITVGLLANRLTVTEKNGSRITDNWIYIQEPDVQVGRLQVFNNWSPYMVKDPDKTWIGLEYFCREGDELWNLSDDELIRLGKSELHKINILNQADVMDGVVIRMPKTYPAYFGSYDRFDQVRNWLDRFDNLFLIGRNGMHRYNNQDHSMLTAMTAVDNILQNRTDKSNIWEVNTEQDYHEES